MFSSPSAQVRLEKLNISEELESRINSWLKNYAELHYGGYSDTKAVGELDLEGLEISESLKNELPDSKIEYCSGATMEKSIAEARLRSDGADPI